MKYLTMVLDAIEYLIHLVTLGGSVVLILIATWQISIGSGWNGYEKIIAGLILILINYVCRILLVRK